MIQKKSFSMSTIVTLILISAFSVGLLNLTVFPSIALYLGLITGEQYALITTKFYEFGFQVMQSIISTQTLFR